MAEKIVYIVFPGKPEIFYPNGDPENALQSAEQWAAGLCQETQQTQTIMCVPREYAQKTLEARWQGVVIHSSEEETS